VWGKEECNAEKLQVASLFCGIVAKRGHLYGTLVRTIGHAHRNWATIGGGGRIEDIEQSQ